MKNLQRREGRTVFQWMGSGVWLLNRYALPVVVAALVGTVALWVFHLGGTVGGGR